MLAERRSSWASSMWVIGQNRIHLIKNTYDPRLIVELCVSPTILVTRASQRGLCLRLE